MRTQDELVARLRARQPGDMLGFEWQEYLRGMEPPALETIRADFFQPDADLSEHKPDLVSDETIRTELVDYMEFAWGKANNGRGISANRSLCHYIAWLWMLGEDGFDDLVDKSEGYGQNQLARICEFLELSPSDYWNRS